MTIVDTGECMVWWWSWRDTCRSLPMSLTYLLLLGWSRNLLRRREKIHYWHWHLFDDDVLTLSLSFNMIGPTNVLTVMQKMTFVLNRIQRIEGQYMFWGLLIFCLIDAKFWMCLCIDIGSLHKKIKILLIL